MRQLKPDPAESSCDEIGGVWPKLDWLFLRCDAYAYPGAPGCVSPVHVFTPISGLETNLGFYGILYGDVTGNWLPAP